MLLDLFGNELIAKKKYFFFKLNDKCHMFVYVIYLDVIKRRGIDLAPTTFFLCRSFISP